MKVVPALLGQGSTAFGGAEHHRGLLGPSPAAFYEAEHHHFLPRHRSSAFGGCLHDDFAREDEEETDEEQVIVPDL